MKRLGLTILGVAVAGTLVGCGDDRGLVPVSGVVTFSGGPAPKPGRVTFVPIEVPKGTPNRPAQAPFMEDGRFVVTSYTTGDGIYPGRYQPEISCSRGPPDYSKRDPWAAVSYVDDGYKAPEVVIEDGSGPLTLQFDVPLKDG